MLQAHVSQSLEGLDFKGRYGMKSYFDSTRPLHIFGMYRYDDLKIYLEHPDEVTLIWQGMDAKTLQWAEDIKSRTAKHIAISHWIKNSLDAYGIKSTYAPVSATIGPANPIPRGDKIYFYTSRISQESSDYYGEFMIDEIHRRTGIEIITTDCNTYTKSALHEVYSSCFINLRLTEYDGLPNTNLEMGLLGRRSVFNGYVPGSIAWNSIDDICESVMKEYHSRHKDNSAISNEVEKFVNSVNKIFI
jgi:hypothetical protein